ncbi:ABC transporter ATP-binding protein [Thalassobacillus devorans]|uniref:ABC transporter ATP-binding protein n=1 Tax=Thalassobacillus devorans TaxID=279813 RepID=A0ABQ1NH51_9BACI|nr:ABC transporter ATP-binding protein [Thalassobacillus devorans]NIK27336.1 energy-coupling factor transport system ATP-binding protein [Thalassobacillus devorans]GGC76923.1 ABC transporter ATP-binding protein [Thalassobacillus devorans]
MTTIASMTNMRLKFPGVESLLFEDFSLSFEKGEKVLILGPSGSGKSTLLQVLTGLIPSAVAVPMKADALTIPESWGFLFQDPDAQFCMPYVDEEIAFVLENLQIPREEMEQYIDHYLHQVGLRFDDNHTKIQTLSGGMKQRLAIASVLALEPELLCLDEPTAMLDPEGTKLVWDTIKNVGNDKTVVIVEHKIEQVVDFVDRVILLDENGTIIADGPKQQVFDQYKHVLIEQGIWYPGVWEDYMQDKSRHIPQSVNTEDAKPAVHLSDFSAFRGKVKALQVEEARAHPGEWVTILGENGAGKSTLLLAMMNLLKTTGTYKIFEQDYKRIKHLAEYVSFVFQNPEFQFVTNSVYEEIAFSLHLAKWEQEKIARRVDEMLKLYYLEDYRHTHPYQLSMGQKRRLSVAASIVKEQPIILLDEPTFGQDAKNTFAILEQLEQLRAQGTTIIMVTHDLNIVKNFATKVWRMEDGELVMESPAPNDIETLQPAVIS